jgi:hypothetical protein
VIDRVDDWLALQPGQRAALESRVEPWLERLAEERLAAYAAFLRALAERNADGLDRADIDWARERARTHYAELAAGAIGWLAPVLADLEPAQVEHLRGRIEEKNVEYRARYLDLTRESSRRAMAGRLVDAIERWTGPLSVDQTEAVIAGVRALPDTSRAWYAYRLRMQAGLLALVDGDADAGAIDHHLRDWWIDSASLRDDEQARFEAYERAMTDVFADLAPTLSPLQRAAVGRRLRDLAAGLESVARQPR